MNKKRIAIVGIALAVVTALTVGTFAYLNATKETQNKIQIAKGKAEITEQFSSPSSQSSDSETEKVVKVKNTDIADCYVRVYMDFSDSTVGKNVSLFTDDTTSYDSFTAFQNALANKTEGWVYVNDNSKLGGYFYYTEPLKPNKETAPLLTKIQNHYGNNSQVMDYDLVVYSETVQTIETGSGEDYATDTANGWKRAWASFLNPLT